MIIALLTLFKLFLLQLWSLYKCICFRCYRFVVGSRRDPVLLRKGKDKTIGIMHFNADANGGGEKVLWALAELLCKDFDGVVVVYVRSGIDKENCLRLAR
jgi:hypothetical protein